MMALTTMNPKTRRLIKVTPDDAQKHLKCLICFWVIIWTDEKNIFLITDIFILMPQM